MYGYEKCRTVYFILGFFSDQLLHIFYTSIPPPYPITILLLSDYYFLLVSTAYDVFKNPIFLFSFFTGQ